MAVSVLWLFLMMPLVGLQPMSEVFPGQTYFFEYFQVDTQSEPYMRTTFSSVPIVLDLLQVFFHMRVIHNVFDFSLLVQDSNLDVFHA